ncbi:MAG: restriction endonuclease subunit S [bacterium]|nr:restriction endonuclease subunit S [bacterium]
MKKGHRPNGRRPLPIYQVKHSTLPTKTQQYWVIHTCMATFSIIQKSQLEGAHRLDAEYYQPEYLALEQKFTMLETKTLEQISKSVISFGAYSLTSHIEWQESGVPYINVGDVHDGYIDLSSVKYISEKVNEILKKSKVNNGQVLLTMAGTIGNAAIAHNLPRSANANQAIAKITPLDTMSPYYLTAFLNSKYGLLQTQREIVSSVQANIFLGQIKKFKIPIFDQKVTQQIGDTYKYFLHELENSKSLYTQAEQLLLEELGLKDFTTDGDLYSIINFSDIENAHRMDAEYFQPKYKKLLAKLRSDKASSLEEVFDNVLAKFNTLVQPDKSFNYVELSNINSAIGTIDGFTKVLGKEAPSRAKRVLKAGDVIVSSVEGSLGKVALVTQEQEGYLASTGFFQFRSDEVLPEVLLVIAKSFIVQNQLTQRCAGTILTAVPKESIKDILIPILPRAAQQKIAELVRQSHEARIKAKELLEEAKQKVEQLIEKGGERG